MPGVWLTALQPLLLEGRQAAHLSPPGAAREPRGSAGLLPQVIRDLCCGAAGLAPGEEQTRRVKALPLRSTSPLPRQDVSHPGLSGRPLSKVQPQISGGCRAPGRGGELGGLSGVSGTQELQQRRPRAVLGAHPDRSRNGLPRLALSRWPKPLCWPGALFWCTRLLPGHPGVPSSLCCVSRQGCVPQGCVPGCPPQAAPHPRGQGALGTGALPSSHPPPPHPPGSPAPQRGS